MKMFRKVLSVLLIFTFVFSIAGCATFNTLNNAEINGPKLFSGTRLNLNAINKNEVALKKFNVPPPKYPLLDLPGSFVLDILVSPLTGGAALYEELVY